MTNQNVAEAFQIANFYVEAARMYRDRAVAIATDYPTAAQTLCMSGLESVEVAWAALAGVPKEWPLLDDLEDVAADLESLLERLSAGEAGEEAAADGR